MSFWKVVLFGVVAGITQAVTLSVFIAGSIITFKKKVTGPYIKKKEDTPKKDKAEGE